MRTFSLSLFLLLVATPAAALPTEKVAERALGATVSVIARDDDGKVRRASGFLVSKDVVATTLRMVSGAASLSVKRPGDDREHAVDTIYGRDRRRNLILLKLDKPIAGARALRLAKKAPGVGATVYAIAAPPGSATGTFTRGLVSGIVERGASQLVQMDAKVVRGAEGGPLVDDDAAVVGVLLEEVRDGGDFSYAITVDPLRTLKKTPEKVDPTAGIRDAAVTAWEEGLGHDEAKRFEQAADAFARAYELDDKLVRAVKRRGRALAQAGRHQDAAQIFTRYLEMEPRDKDARYELGEAWFQMGHLYEAHEVFTRWMKEENRTARAAYKKRVSDVLADLQKRYERRVVVMTVEGDDERAKVATERLAERLKLRSKLVVVRADKIPAAHFTTKSGEACREKHTCVWKPGWARWVLKGELDEGEGFPLTLSLFDVRAKKRLAKTELTSTGADQLPLDLDDGLPEMFAQLPDGLGEMIGRADGGRRPVGDVDDDSDDSDDSDDDAVANVYGPGGLGTDDDAAVGGLMGEPIEEEPVRRRALADDEPAPQKGTMAAAVAADEAPPLPILPWVLIGSGVLVAGGGAAFDLLSPTSANYNIGVLDFVGPGVMAGGVVLVAVGVILGPFGGDDEG
jgi:tetratricopeptide (TPR) repeat protein